MSGQVSRNRLVKAVKADGTTMVYGYNTSGLRVESVKNPTGVNAAGLPTGGTAIRYLLSGSEEIADLDSGRNVIRRYIPGAGIDERVAQLDAAGNVVFIHNDKQNSVIAISNILGAVIQKRAYGTYGETDAAQMTSAGTLGTQPHPFGYTGRRWDPDLGLYYYRARWYDPQLGTFLETDPIGSLDYVNLYSYVGLEPGNYEDPDGDCAQLCSAAIGAGVGAGIEAAVQIYEHGEVRDWGAVGREALIGGVAGATGAGATRLVERGASVAARIAVGGRAATHVARVGSQAVGGAIGGGTASGLRESATTGRLPRVATVAQGARDGAAFAAGGAAIGARAGAVIDRAAGRNPRLPDFRSPSRQPAAIGAASGSSNAQRANDVNERRSCPPSSLKAGTC